MRAQTDEDLLLIATHVPSRIDAPFDAAMRWRLVGPELLRFASYQEALLVASEAAFSSRRFFDQHLAFALLQGLKRHGASQKVFDGLDGSELAFDKLLAAAIALSKLIRKETAKPRVAIVLPPGKGGILANVAALLAKWGQRVLIVDWDLEAPGIEKYFQRWIDQTGRPTKGIVDMIEAFSHGKRCQVQFEFVLTPMAHHPRERNAHRADLFTAPAE